MITRVVLLPSLVAFVSACSSPQAKLEVPEEFKKGQATFHRVCSNCHNSDAMGGLTRAPKLIDTDYTPVNFSDDEIRDTILNGSSSKKMPSQKAKIKADEIPEIIKYLRYSQKAARLPMEKPEDDKDEENSKDS